MTPATTGKGKGNFQIDRRYPNVGRIRMSLGTKSLRKFRQREALIDKLYQQDRFEMLRALKRGDVTIQELVELDLQDRLGNSSAGSVVLKQNLWTAAENARASMLPKSTTSADYRKRQKTVRRYAVAFRALERKGGEWLGPDANVGDLADVKWSELWERWDAGPTDWMHTKEAVSRTLTVLFGDKYHPFARQIRSAIPSKKATKRRPNLKYAQFKKIVALAPIHAAPSYWTIALTGMRVGEYLACRREHLDASTHTLNVPGGKSEAAPQQIDARIWKTVAAGIPSRLQYKWLNIYWNRAREKAGFPGVTLHDLRHSAGQWAIDEHVPESAVQSFYRHETPGQTRDYVIRSATLEVSSAIADVVERDSKKRKRA
jgi:integrase